VVSERAQRESLVCRPGAARSTVQQRRRRWAQGSARVAELLADAPHPDTPATSTAEQIHGLRARADSERPITRWPRQELADEEVRRGIVAAWRVARRAVLAQVVATGTIRSSSTSRPRHPGRALPTWASVPDTGLLRP